MAYNKVVYGGKTLMDLTGDSVTPDKLLAGETAHDKSGETIAGTCREALGLEGRQGAWPGLQPSPPSPPVSLCDSSPGPPSLNVP